MKFIKSFEDYYNDGITFKEYVYQNKDESTLSCQNARLKDLDGIELFTNLVNLYCFSNKLTNLKGIENLTNLNYLDCSDNQITSLKGVENLNNLVYLYCENNPIDWVDYIDKQGNIYYIKLPKSIKWHQSKHFSDIRLYWNWFEKNQPVAVSRKFNF